MPKVRYPTDRVLVTNYDPFQVTSDWLSFLTAHEYVVDLLRKTHAVPAKSASARADEIIPHVRMAIDYIHQTLDGPASISFLPAYYALLNLMKVYVLLGPRHADLAKNRYHGATYNVGGKDSHTVLTEIVTLKQGGVFPLFYETITGKTLTQNKLRISMKEVLPYVLSISYEYELATGTPSQHCGLDLGIVDKQGVKYLQCQVRTRTGLVPKSELKALTAFRAISGQANAFISATPMNTGTDKLAFRERLRPHMLFRSQPGTWVTVRCKRRLEMFEEWPIAVLFFYTSSVARYRPEFFSRLQDSKFWPVLATARLHAFGAFLLSFWSFMQQENIFISAPRQASVFSL